MADTTGVNTNEVLSLILTTQYFDTLKAMSEHENNTIFMSHSPAGAADVQTQMLSALEAASKSAANASKH